MISPRWVFLGSLQGYRLMEKHPAATTLLTMDTIESALPDTLPVKSINASSRFVLVTPDFSVISEHDTTPDAVRALAKFSLENPKSEAAIFRRASTHWQRY